MLTFRELLSRSEGHPEPAFCRSLTTRQSPGDLHPERPKLPSKPRESSRAATQPFPIDLKWEFSSLSWLARRLDSSPLPTSTETAVGRIPTLASPWACQGGPSGTGRRRTCDWELQVTPRHLLHPQKLCWRGGGRGGLLVCTSESLFWRWEFEIEAINPGLSLPPQLFTPPQSPGINQTPSPELALLPVQSASSTPIRVCREVHLSGLLGAPLSPFKCTHQPT